MNEDGNGGQNTGEQNTGGQGDPWAGHLGEFALDSKQSTNKEKQEKNPWDRISEVALFDEQPSTDGMTLIEPGAGDVERKTRVFIEPPEFNADPIKTSLSEGERVFVVVGQETIEGTTTVAINLALKIIEEEAENRGNPEWQKDPWTLIRLNDNDDLQRIEYIRSRAKEEFVNHCIYIIKRVGDRKLLRDELTEEKLKRYQSIFDRENAYVILTLIEENFERVKRPATKSIIRVENAKIKKEKVFDANLAYDFEGDLLSNADKKKRELLVKYRQQIQESANPAQIGTILIRFKDEVNVSDPAELEKQLLEIIEDVTNQKRITREFFEQLNFNERMFGMLVALLNTSGFGAEFTLFDVEELYHLTNNALLDSMTHANIRIDNNAFIDPRMTGIYDLLDKLGIGGRRQSDIIMRFDENKNAANKVAFTDHNVHQNFANQVVNYHRLLWVLEDVLLNILDGNTQPHFQRTRPSVVSRLLGQIGIYQPVRLTNLLNRLLDDYVNIFKRQWDGLEHSVQMIMPNAFDARRHPFLLSILDSWVPGNDDDTRGSQAPDGRRYQQWHRLLFSGVSLPGIYAHTSENTSDQNTIKQLRQLMSRLVHQSIRYRDDLLPEIQGMRQGWDGYLSQLREQLKSTIRENVDTQNPDTDEAAIESFVDNFISDLYKRRDHSISEYVADIVVKWLGTSLLSTTQAFDRLAAHSTDMADEAISILIDLIEPPLNRDLFNYFHDLVERGEERQIDEMLTEILKEDDPLAARRAAKENENETLTLKDSVWYVAVTIANYLFLQRASGGRNKLKQLELDQTDAPIQDDVVATADTISETEDTDAADDSASLPDQGSTDADDDSDASNLDAEDGPLTLDTESEATEPPVKEKAAVDDGSGETPADDEPEPENNPSLIELYEYLKPMMRLLPLMLRASPFFGDMKAFFHGLTYSEDILKHYSFPRQESKKKPTPINGYKVWFDNETEIRMTVPPITIALLSLHSWFEIVEPYPESRDEWINIVHPTLLKMVNDAQQVERHYLRSALFDTGWLESPYEALRNLARALIARSYIMDGYVMDLPLPAQGTKLQDARRYGVVVLDASASPWGIFRNIYFQHAFNLIQRLSLLTPIRVHYLGYTSDYHLFGVSGQDDKKQPSKAQHLIPKRTRSNLIMPLMEPLPGSQTPEIDPDKAHFVLVFSPINLSEGTWRREIVDIDDLVNLAFNTNQTAIQVYDWDPFTNDAVDASGASADDWDDPFAKHADAGQSSTEDDDLEEMTATTENSVTWEWKQKFFLLSSTRQILINQLDDVIFNTTQGGKQLGIEQHVTDLINIHNVWEVFIAHEQIEALEQALRHQLTAQLQQLSPQDIQQDLKQYESALSVDFTDYESLLGKLDEWVVTLDDRSTAQHPRDVTLTIAWVVLMIAKDSDKPIEPVVELLTDWLMAEDRLKRLMGTALTRMLFNFYSVVNIAEHLDEGRRLLKLVAPFIEANRERDDFTTIMRVIMQWSEESLWAREITAKDPTFLSAIRKLKNRKTISLTLRLINEVEVETALRAIYSKLDLPFDDFKKLTLDMSKYVGSRISESRKIQRREQLTTLYTEEPLDKTTLEDLENVLARNEFRHRGFAIMQSLNADSELLRMEEAVQQNELIYRNICAVANSIRMELYHKLGSKPRLQNSEQRYGIIIVDTTSPGAGTMISTAITLIRNVQRTLRQNKRQRDIMFTVHRLGHGELVHSGVSGSPSPKQMRSRELRQHVPLVGPILDLYESEQVGFVMVFSALPIHDMADWAEQSEWVDHFWMYSTNNSWLLSSGVDGTRGRNNTKKDVQELTTEVLKKIGI